MKKAMNILVLTIFAFAILASCSPETPVKPTPDQVELIIQMSADFSEAFALGLLSGYWKVEGNPDGDYSAILAKDYQCSINGDKLIVGSGIRVSQNGAYSSLSLTVEIKDDGRHTLSISGPVDGVPDSIRLDGKLIDPSGIDMPDIQ